MFRRAIVTGAMVGVLLVAFLVPCLLPGTAEAAQHSPPWAARYTFNAYPDGPDTTLVDTIFQVYVGDYAGYDDHTMHNNAASQAISEWQMPYIYNYGMPGDAVFSFVGHGRYKSSTRNGGYIVFYNPYTGYSDIRADGGMPTWHSDVENLNEVSDLWDMRLMVLTACCSSHRYYPSDWWTSLTEQAVYLGVDCALGFDVRIVASNALNWEVYFWECVGLSGDNVNDAAYYAAEAVLYYLGDYGFVDQYVIEGNPFITIKPAAYGA